ncbi:hypothetical protein BGX30_010816 [Mortierella sp. GBA39]|nr:hypothetical protein BGX30_010816 [Mortierella sp. GBA39]
MQPVSKHGTDPSQSTRTPLIVGSVQIDGNDNKSGFILNSPLSKLVLKDCDFKDANWTALFNTIDKLTLKVLEIGRRLFTKTQLGFLVGRCISTVARITALEEYARSLSEQLAVEDLNIQRTLPLFIYIYGTNATREDISKAMRKLRANDTEWVQFRIEQ